MASRLKLKFDPNQKYQLRAIESAVQLFEGLPAHETDLVLGGEIISNLPQEEFLDESWLLENLQTIQEQNGLEQNIRLDSDDGFMLENISVDSWRYPQFTIEMETGTGKTYVYLRTIHELRQKYGFRKFIIIVPSIAIYEGVIKSFQITKSHFNTLYGNEPIHLTQYSGNQLSRLRGFATSSFTEIMVMTIDAFNKAKNNIYKNTEKLPGEMRPFEYIQRTRPIMILDECQNYRSEKSKQALRTLQPIFSLNYSATPMNKPNLIYRLTPVDAFKQNLVKKIEVLGVKEQYHYEAQQMSLRLKSIDHTGYGLAATIHLFVNRNGELVESELTVKKNEDLYQKTKNENYRGIIVEEIDKENGVVVFTNQDQISLRDSIDITSTKEDIFRVQIENTIKYHFQKQKELIGRGIKVLSLFLIDRVANYIENDGIIKRLFDEAFENLKHDYPFFKGWKAEEVREGYFAKKKVKNQPLEYVDTTIETEKKTAKDKQLEKAAYELIMKDKERLLSFDEKVCFVFAHSALKEGWDNPNVFQICTLNQTQSEMKKRQEIGRGLRLAVDQSGERIIDDMVNVLTVIANESYEDYVAQLQDEYYQTGDAAPPKPSRAGKTDAHRNDKIYKSDDFQKFWEKLCQKTEYQIHFDTEKFIESCAIKFENTEVPDPQLVITKGKFVMVDYSITLEDIKPGKALIKIEISDTDGNIGLLQNWFSKGQEISREFKDQRLKGYKIVDIIHNELSSKVVFGDKGELNLKESICFQCQKGQQPISKNIHERQSSYPVFNLIDRAEKETKLTRKTIVKIFKRLSESKKRQIFKNPEGFANVFIKTIKEHLADHIADKIEYTLKDELENYDIELLFPRKLQFPQKELVEGANFSLYDKIQIDSDIEENFVRNYLNEDKEVICYFKFPYRFKINMPKIIGNYNPDWGIIRWGEGQKFKLQLVRETKGQRDLNLLQFRNEPRKIHCAKKHFDKIKIDYKHIQGNEPFWWK